MKFLLVLKHSSYPHFEYWRLDNNRNVHVEFDTPYNSPSKGSHTLTPVQALRQYCLLTSKEEGWEVALQGQGWHKFLDELEVN
jgi:hypothetical protein